VRCACEDMVKLKSYNNWTRIQQRGEGKTHWSGGRHGGAGSIELGGGKREWPRPVWRRRELGRSFYRCPGREKGARGGGHRRACHGGDGGAQWQRRDGSGRGGDGMVRLAQGDRGARRQPSRRASNGETTGRWRPAVIASLARSQARGRR
jgi:hypothetical protein